MDSPSELSRRYYVTARVSPLISNLEAWRSIKGNVTDRNAAGPRVFLYTKRHAHSDSL
jgi:hypothetical protein